MTYKQIKWLILIIPTLTLGAWEYVRHQFLLPYLSMEVGNWLAPVIVFLVTITFLVRLFTMLERTQSELNKERAERAKLKEREQIAEELHDGIAQSLFLLSVKMNRLEEEIPLDNAETYVQVRETMHRIHDDVRQSIANLKYPIVQDMLPWEYSLEKLILEIKQDTGLDVELDWDIDLLSAKEKIELYAIIKEALLNVYKHANAGWARVSGRRMNVGWVCTVEDDGEGFAEDPFAKTNSYGLRIIRERTQKSSWTLKLERVAGKTVLEIKNEVNNFQ